MWQRPKARSDSFAGPTAKNPAREQWWADHEEAVAIIRYIEGLAVRRGPAGRWWPVRRAHD